MSDEKPLLSISDEGIEINLKKGNSIRTHATNTSMRGVKQNVDGGVLEHRATEKLIQIDNTMRATKGGKILNEVTEGELDQRGNRMEADEKGEITNRVASRIRIKKLAVWVLLFSGVVTAVGLLSDSISLLDWFSRK